MVLVAGIVPVPVRYSFWFELALGTLIVPSAGTFAAHFAGTLAGLVSVYVPRMSGWGALGGSVRGGRNRAYRGRGNRLGGRYLRDDAPRDTRDVGDGIDGLDGSPASARSRGTPVGGAGRRLGGGDRRDPRRNRGAVLAKAWKVLCVPFVRFKLAMDEGAPLVVHGAFALGCLVLQQTMARHCPEGLLRRVSLPPINVPFSLGN